MKYKVGEIVEYCGFTKSDRGCNGMEVEIFAVGPFKKGDRINGKPTVFPGDYLVTEPDGEMWLVDEINLRKRRPPFEPADEEFTAELRNMLKHGVKA